MKPFPLSLLENKDRKCFHEADARDRDLNIVATLNEEIFTIRIVAFRNTDDEVCLDVQDRFQ